MILIVVVVWKHCHSIVFVCIVYVGSMVVVSMLLYCDGYNGDCCMAMLFMW
jgi:hypothetical protein